MRKGGAVLVQLQYRLVWHVHALQSVRYVMKSEHHVSVLTNQITWTVLKILDRTSKFWVKKHNSHNSSRLSVSCSKSYLSSSLNGLQPSYSTLLPRWQKETKENSIRKGKGELCKWMMSVQLNIDIWWRPCQPWICQSVKEAIGRRRREKVIDTCFPRPR